MAYIGYIVYSFLEEYAPVFHCSLCSTHVLEILCQKDYKALLVFYQGAGENESGEFAFYKCYLEIVAPPIFDVYVWNS